VQGDAYHDDGLLRQERLAAFDADVVRSPDQLSKSGLGWGLAIPRRLLDGRMAASWPATSYALPRWRPGGTEGD
jgi:hypothetical protein